MLQTMKHRKNRSLQSFFKGSFPLFLGSRNGGHSVKDPLLENDANAIGSKELRCAAISMPLRMDPSARLADEDYLSPVDCLMSVP
jgi:hypothetical protein